MTRPDVANAAATKIVRQAHESAPCRWKAALKILQYLRDSRDIGFPVNVVTNWKRLLMHFLPKMMMIADLFRVQ